MLKQLKAIFPSLIYGAYTNTIDKQAYLWFTTPADEVIGINKTEITNKDKALLLTFLTPYNGVQQPTSEAEKYWSSYLFHDQTFQRKQQSTTYRFIFFSLSEPPVDVADFQEAIYALFPKHVPILWETPLEGVIIEEDKPPVDEEIDYTNIIDVFSSDFYLDLQLFISPFFSNISKANAYYHWLKKAYELSKHTNKKSVVDYTEIIPLLFKPSLTENDYKLMVDTVLQETREDETLLETIQTFLECNSNVSLTAKKMYMHRNSLQYRIEKFIEKTTIDVKQFTNAVSVYLILLLKQKID
ncbi:PucR family transcriptional regulator [Paraliobacillus ryukyuensis]|uniref:PucR family transcriptional regulator n=1 Tax=Paraliobacillus ryukyuensis TaxID=200904 RepID=UPI0009A68051|nr:helix-turn-helix domain-containing protein [Paraliobacillus ryukyuensis]